MIKCLWMKWPTQTQPLKPLYLPSIFVWETIRSQKCDYHLPRPLKYMFRYLNQVPMCSESEYTAKSIFSAPFGGHLGFMQIRWSSTPWIQLDILYVMWGTYLEQMVKKSILLQFVVGSPICSHICTGLYDNHILHCI